MENKTKIKTKKQDNSHSLQSFLFISKPGESVGEMCMSSSEIKTVELVLCSFHCSGKKEKKKDIQVQVTKNHCMILVIPHKS